MGKYFGLAVMVGVALLLSTGQCAVNCKGEDGHPGKLGIKGRDGLPGPKGEKGEPALMEPVDPARLLTLRGDVGKRGFPGPMGPKGYRGELGAPGRPGITGEPGPDGRAIGQDGDAPQQGMSAFSVIRTHNNYPSYNQKITYQVAAVNKPGDMNLNTGDFTCRIPGVYYFVFQATSKTSLCLRLANDSPTPEKLGFCNYNRNLDQVLSGGAVFQLERGQKVWLESFRDSQTEADARDTRDKQIIFSGFLLFAKSP